MTFTLEASGFFDKSKPSFFPGQGSLWQRSVLLRVTCDTHVYTQAWQVTKCSYAAEWLSERVGLVCSELHTCPDAGWICSGDEGGFRFQQEWRPKSVSSKFMFWYRIPKNKRMISLNHHVLSNFMSFESRELWEKCFQEILVQASLQSIFLIGNWWGRAQPIVGTVLGGPGLYKKAG